MAEYNLLRTVPKIFRDVPGRKINKDTNRAEALKFDWAYFDGPREQGYGGYSYDGRWVAVAQDVINRYQLHPGKKVLDVGCAKGFLVKDLVDQGIDAYGLDISSYGITKCPLDIAGRLHLGNAISLPFPDKCFDAVLAINVIHNLHYSDCITALREICRVSRYPDRCFVQVDAYRTEAERLYFEDWCLTAKTYLPPAEWKDMFAQAGYTGDFFWTIMIPEPDTPS